MVYDRYRAYLKIWLAWKLWVECFVENIRHTFKVCLKIENIRCAFKITILWFLMLWKRSQQKEAFMKLPDFEWVSQILLQDETKFSMSNVSEEVWRLQIGLTLYLKMYNFSTKWHISPLLCLLLQSFWCRNCSLRNLQGLKFHVNDDNVDVNIEIGENDHDVV